MRSFDDEVTLTIDGMDSKSRGIARMDGYVVFVPGALVGETVLAKFVERRKHYGAEGVTFSTPHMVISLVRKNT